MPAADSTISWRNRLVWFVLVSFMMVLLAGWVHQAIQRPFSAIGALILFCCLLWYWSTEDASESGSMLHQHSEFEVVFWSVIAFFCGVILFILPDSPLLGFIQYSRSQIFLAISDSATVVNEDDRILSFGWSLLLTFVVAYSTLNIVRARHRRELTYKPEVFLRRLSSGLLATSTPERRASVKESLHLLEECLDQLDHEYLPSSLSRFIRYSKKLLSEAKIVRIFKEAGSEGGEGFSQEEYSYMILKTDLALILYKVKDHNVAAHRTQLIKILSEQRLSLQTTAAKAMVLYSLQQLKISSARVIMETAVCNIITSCFGHELTELKAITDSKGNYHSLHKLVFHDIKATQSRRSITEHMLREAKLISASERVAAANKAEHVSFLIPKSRSLPAIAINPTTPPPEPPEAPQCYEYGKVKVNPYIFSDGSSRRLIQAKTKIVSDVDDTFVCSGAVYPAGVDRRYPRKTVYPGVGAFYRELDLSGSGDLTSQMQVRGWYEDSADLLLGNLVFLSARPHIYKDFIESAEYRKYRVWRQEGNLHCIPMLLPGSAMEGMDFVLRGKLESLAENKFNNLQEYALLYPEYTYIFIGDNGQADVRAVAKVMDVPFVNIKMAYIHQVQAQDLTFGLPAEDEYKMSKIFFFTNYVQAALHAFKKQFLSAPGLCRVTISAVEQFDAIGGTDDATREDLAASVTEVMAYLDWLTSSKPVSEMSVEVSDAVKEYLAKMKLPGVQTAIVAITTPT